MATSKLEARLREQKRRYRRGETSIGEALGSDWQQAAPQGMLPNRPAPLPAPQMPANPMASQAPAPLFSNLTPAPASAPIAPMGRRLSPVEQMMPPPSAVPAPQRPSPTQLSGAPTAAPQPQSGAAPEAVRQPPGAMGLRNFAGDPYGTQMQLENWRNAQQGSQSVVLNPTVGMQSGGGGWGASAAPGQPWHNPIPTGPQYPTVYGQPDPMGTFDPNDPVPSWIGNLPRMGMNVIPNAAGGAAILGQGIWSGAKEAYRQIATSANQREREDQAAQAAEAAITQQPAPAARRYTLQQPAEPTPSSIAPAAPAASVMDLTATGQQGLEGVTPGAETQPQSGAPAQPIANTGTWNNSPPAALEMAQVWQSRGWSPNAIAGMLGQAAGESGYGVNTAPGDAGTAAGSIFQHRNERAAERARFAQHYGLDPNDPSTEAMFVDAEMRGDEASGVLPTEAYAWSQLQGAQTPYEAAAAGLHFERPENYSRTQFDPTRVAGWNNRLQGAEQTAALLSGNPLPPYQEAWREAQPPMLPNLWTGQCRSRQTILQ